MNTFLRIFHPFFSWAIFIAYGLELIHNQVYLPMIIVVLGLAGLSQTFWRIHLGEKQQYAKLDILSFGIGLIAAITYPLVVVWNVFVQ